jgi:hypothetical protein
MTKLSDTQRIILSAASQRADRKLNDPVWRDRDDGHGLTLIITDEGFAAIGIEVEPQKTKAPKPEPKPAPTERKTREGTKQALLIELLKRPQGATIPEIAEATQWMQHTIRGAMAGTLKKKLGLVITSEKDEVRGRCYKIEP